MSNLQDFFEGRSDGSIILKSNGMIVGTGAGAKSVVFSNTDGQIQLVGNATGETVSVNLPTTGGTVLLSGQALGAIGASNLGNTSGTSGVVSQQFLIAASNGLIGSQSINGGSATLSLINSWSTATTVSSVASANAVGADAGRFALEGHQHAGVPAIAAGSDTGNTAGNTASKHGTWVIAGTDNITVSGSTGGAGVHTVWLSAPSPGAGAGFTAGVSNVGNTAGSTGTVSNRAVFAGGAGIVLSQSTGGASSATISVVNSWSTATTVSSVASANEVGADAGRFALEGHQHAGVPALAAGSNAGNTSGDTASKHGTWVIAGTNNITISGSTGGAGVHTAWISAAAGGAAMTHKIFNPYQGEQLVAGQAGQGTMFIQPMIAEVNFQHDRFGMRINFTNASNSTGSVTLSWWIGIYTRNVSTLSLASSTSHTQGVTFSGTVGNGSLQLGARVYTIGWTNTVTEGDYWLGIISRTTSGGANASVSQFQASQLNSAYSGIFGVASNASDQRILGFGILSATTSGAPASVAFSNMRGNNSSVHRPPVYFFISQTA